MQRIAIVSLALALGLACAKPPPSPEIQRAEGAYSAALEDPLVDQKDSVQLLEAGDEIQRAQEAHEDGEPDLVTHYVYLAETRIRIARLTAETKAANRKAQELAAERPELRLEARTAEADVATERALEAEKEARAATDRADRLQRDLDEMEARQTERGHVLTLGGVSFDFNEATLKPAAARQLSLLAGFLIANPEREVLVEGYADATGSEPVNLDISRQRAEAVKRYLVANGVAADRIHLEAHGKGMPLEANTTAGGREVNRRAQVTILGPGVAAR